MKRCIALSAIAACASGALAGPTVLINIPIADILGHREFAYIYGVSGTEARIDKRWYSYQGYAIGLFDILELGLENDFLGTSELSLRLKLLEDPKDARWALSVGARAWHNGEEGSWHLMGRYDLPHFRIHGGVVKSDEHRWVLGLDGPVFGDSTWLLEHTSGTGAITWGGLSVPVKGIAGLSVTAAIGVPGDRSIGTQYSLSLYWGTKF
jgi:hypothetical protein